MREIKGHQLVNHVRGFYSSGSDKPHKSRNRGTTRGKVGASNGVKLIVGMIGNRRDLFEEAKRRLVERFGQVDCQSDIMAFDKTNYYEREMGPNLRRKFYSFKKLIHPEELAKIKILTNGLEREFLNESGGREVNLDPGYLAPGKLVLASTKDYQHRIYLGNGIYGEVTLRFRRGSFWPWEWTYPDYRSTQYIDFFNHVRKLYKAQIRRETSK